MEIVTTTWVWFKADLSTIRDCISGSSPLDDKVKRAAGRAIALLIAAFLTFKAIESLANDSILFACTDLLMAGIAFDFFLLFKKFSEIKEPFKSALISASDKGMIDGIVDLGRSISSQAEMYNSCDEKGRIKVTILTQDTNFPFIWNWALVSDCSEIVYA